MRFLLIIYGDERRWASAVGEAAKAEVDAYWALDNEATAAGVFVESAGLYPTETARTLRIRDDERTVTDGPFAETKEQLGGFYVLDCKDLDEVLDWAEKCPAIHAATMELGGPTSAEIIERATESTLAKAEELGCRSLALVAFGTGVGGFPLEEAARIMVGAARDHEGALERVVFAVHGDDAERAFSEAL